MQDYRQQTEENIYITDGLSLKELQLVMIWLSCLPISLKVRGQANSAVA